MAEAGFGEYLYDRATLPPGFTYGTFWATEPLGGDCVEVDFRDGEPVVGERSPPYSNGRLQAFLRKAADTNPSFRLSLCFGMHDWVDCRPFVDIAREFDSVNATTGGAMVRIPNCGHQLILDHPEGFVDAICTMVGHNLC